MRIDQCAQTAVKLGPDVFGAPKEKAAEFQKSVVRQYYLEGSPLPASPTDHHSIDMRLLQPFFGDDPALKAIMDDIHNTPSPVFKVLGVPGSGKTATIMQLAREHFVIYIDCSTKFDHEEGEFCDPNFTQLVQDIDATIGPLKEFITQGQPNLLPTVNHSTSNRILQECLARLVVLHQLLVTKPDLTPEEFLMYLLNSGGHQAVADILETVKGIMPAYPRNYVRWFVVRVSFVLGILLLVFDS